MSPSARFMIDPGVCLFWPGLGMRKPPNRAWPAEQRSRDAFLSQREYRGDHLGHCLVRVLSELILHHARVRLDCGKCRSGNFL